VSAAVPAVAPDKPGSKTRWCELCKHRHGLDHEHFKKQGDRAANVVTGAKSGADLSAQAGRDRPADLRKITLEKLQAEKDKEIREIQERRWGRRMRLIYSVWAKIADDPKIKLSDDEEKDFGQIHADFAMAWGITASTKIEASADLAIIHFTVIASRSKWMTELLESLRGKEDEDDEAERSRPQAG
jgi:hypothetical protein